jgi:hypothetical protein
MPAELILNRAGAHPETSEAEVVGNRHAFKNNTRAYGRLVSRWLGPSRPMVLEMFVMFRNIQTATTKVCTSFFKQTGSLTRIQQADSIMESKRSAPGAKEEVGLVT